MKKTVKFFHYCLLVLSLVFTAMLSSCSDKKNVEPQTVIRTPLSEEILKLSDSAQWNYQLEGERLSRRIDRVGMISQNVPLNIYSVIVMEPGLKPVYPSLPDFTVLDVSNIEGEILSLIRNFSRDFIKFRNEHKDVFTASFTIDQENDKENDNKTDIALTRYFSKDNGFSLVLFIYDTEKSGKFIDFVIGEPFISDEFIEVPVRFTTSDEILYTYLYPVEENSKWVLSQIEIYRQEEINGKH